MQQINIHSWWVSHNKIIIDAVGYYYIDLISCFDLICPAVSSLRFRFLGVG